MSVWQVRCVYGLRESSKRTSMKDKLAKVS